ncbi:hypothetical protein RSP673_024270 (plasmid) [Ralstonia solanacearum P673]|uniref:hypothetical protein n=1 Tax=Ralstonia solanacearum TaxID=305 RepID=UPI0038577129
MRQGLAQLDVVRLRVVGCVLVQDQLLLVVDCQVGLAVVRQAVDEASSVNINGRPNKTKSLFLKNHQEWRYAIPIQIHSKIRSKNKKFRNQLHDTE